MKEITKVPIHKHADAKVKMENNVRRTREERKKRTVYFRSALSIVSTRFSNNFIFATTSKCGGSPCSQRNVVVSTPLPA